MKTLLTEFRITRKGTYAPSPIASGLCLIWMGLGLIASGLTRLPVRLFYVVQAALVWQWFGLRRYDRFVAIIAWGITGVLLVIGYLIREFFIWL